MDKENYNYFVPSTDILVAETDMTTAEVIDSLKKVGLNAKLLKLFKGGAALGHRLKKYKVDELIFLEWK